MDAVPFLIGAIVVLAVTGIVTAVLGMRDQGGDEPPPLPPPPPPPLPPG